MKTIIRLLKKIFLSSVSVLGVGLLFWSILFLNPSISYAHATQFDNITVYHNNELDPGVGAVLKSAVSIIKKSALYHENIQLDLCMNDDKFYQRIHPFIGRPLAYAVLNKTIIDNCTPKFSENIAESQWEVNENELRKFKLDYLLAHEFMHNLQTDHDLMYWLSSTIGIRGFSINWKFEGHADYIARESQGDGKLHEKIEIYLAEEKKEHIGFPVFELEDGTMQIMSYYKYSLVFQYLMEEKNMSFAEICETEMDFDNTFQEMVTWSGK